MKIIEPSARIIEDDFPKNIYQRIDACAAVCYQRPAKPTVEEAEQFCRSMVERGHFTTLEMGVVHLVIDEELCTGPESKYLLITYQEDGRYVVSGSIRAFLEAEFTDDISSTLNERLPLFFGDCINYGPTYVKGCEPIRFAEPHEIPWQHKHVAVRFIINRAVSHELVRHRPCSFLQESQRYCRYGDDVTFIQPLGVDIKDEPEIGYWALGDSDKWLKHMFTCEDYYQERLRKGFTPQSARGGLPNDTKTEVICYASLPQWLHIFSLRCSPAADPEMVRIMRPLREQFKSTYPEAFE